MSMLTSSRDERTPYRSTSPAASFPKRVGSSFGSSSDDREKLGNTKLTMVQDVAEARGRRREDVPSGTQSKGGFQLSRNQ